MGAERISEMVKGFKLVHQSGHSNTYCDGSRHINTDGGWCHDAVDDVKELTISIRRKDFECSHLAKCNCEYWKNIDQGGV